MKRELLIQLILDSPLNTGWSEYELEQLRDSQLEEIWENIKKNMGGDPT